jgi:hypothetical protein
MRGLPGFLFPAGSGRCRSMSAVRISGPFGAVAMSPRLVGGGGAAPLFLTGKMGKGSRNIAEESLVESSVHLWIIRTSVCSF